MKLSLIQFNKKNIIVQEKLSKNENKKNIL